MDNFNDIYKYYFDLNINDYNLKKESEKTSYYNLMKKFSKKRINNNEVNLLVNKITEALSDIKNKVYLGNLRFFINSGMYRIKEQLSKENTLRNIYYLALIYCFSPLYRNSKIQETRISNKSITFLSFMNLFENIKYDMEKVEYLESLLKGKDKNREFNDINYISDELEMKFPFEENTNLYKSLILYIGLGSGKIKDESEKETFIRKSISWVCVFIYMNGEPVNSEFLKKFSLLNQSLFDIFRCEGYYNSLILRGVEVDSVVTKIMIIYQDMIEDLNESCEILRDFLKHIRFDFYNFVKSICEKNLSKVFNKKYGNSSKYRKLLNNILKNIEY